MSDRPLQPSLSAPDLTDLLEARQNGHDGLSQLDYDDIESSQSPVDTLEWQERSRKLSQDFRHQLPTPGPSRSPTPDIRNEEVQLNDGDTYRSDLRHLRIRSESPEAYLRHREASTFTEEGDSLCLDSPSAPLNRDAHPDVTLRGHDDSQSSNRTSPSQSQILSPRRPPALKTRLLPASLWDYLKEEIRATELDGSQEMKAERVTNFFAVPMAVERIIIFGFFVCLDSFLYTFTILPLRAGIALRRLIASYLRPGKRKTLPVSAKCDLAKFAIFIITCIVLHYITDASKMYHSVRGQEVIKLYVIFNVLEIADRLCCSFGQDLLDSLCSRATLGRREDGSRPHIRPAGLFGMCVAYTIAHTLVLFYSLVSLNVAINSYDNALLTLLLSNQFVEIKGAVFKKFEKENLFQMSCADIVERFQLSLMLTIVAMRNLIELSGSSFSLLPTSFIPVMPSMTMLQSIFSPALIVIASEMFVDWLKHAFITKFNHIRPAVYGRFIDVLCRDLISGDPSTASNGAAFADQSPALARRLGFASIPLGCLVVRVIFQTIEILADTSHIDECAPPQGRSMVAKGLLGYISIGPEGQAKIVSWLLWAVIAFALWSCLVALKLMIGINLRAYAVSRHIGMDERAREDQLNDRSRPAIGLNSSEKEHEGATKRLIEQKDFDSPGKFTGRIGGPPPKISMENLSRFSMVKSRIY